MVISSKHIPSVTATITLPLYKTVHTHTICRCHIFKAKPLVSLDSLPQYSTLSGLVVLVCRLCYLLHSSCYCPIVIPSMSFAGPMVWYQVFEYAVGHWFQKSTEHVLGCVLCSPGCFSLFRGSALLDDNVMKRYTTKPNEAIEFLQYDQGRNIS